MANDYELMWKRVLNSEKNEISYERDAIPLIVNHSHEHCDFHNLNRYCFISFFFSFVDRHYTDINWSVICIRPIEVTN